MVDTGVLYPLDVADPRINRQKWAEFVARLLTEEAGGNRTKLAELLGVNRRTVIRWLNQETDVSEENVRAVARRLHLSPRELLLDVGFYVGNELAEAGWSVRELTAEQEPALALIEEADLTPAMRRDLLVRLEEMRAKHAEDRATAIRQLLEFHASTRR